MRPRLAFYKENCGHRQTSSWSMQVETQSGRQRALTTEVDIPLRAIFQVRWKCNPLPSANQRAIVERWAALEGLKVAEVIPR